MSQQKAIWLKFRLCYVDMHLMSYIHDQISFHFNFKPTKHHPSNFVRICSPWFFALVRRYHRFENVLSELEISSIKSKLYRKCQPFLSTRKAVLARFTRSGTSEDRIWMINPLQCARVFICAFEFQSPHIHDLLINWTPFLRKSSNQSSTRLQFWHTAMRLLSTNPRSEEAVPQRG